MRPIGDRLAAMEVTIRGADGLTLHGLLLLAGMSVFRSNGPLPPRFGIRT